MLHRGTASEPATIDPGRAAASMAAPMIADMYEGLVVPAADGTPIPGAAESWTVSEDGRSYTFRLRADLRWSDGQALTAEDFVYSYRRLVDPVGPSRLAGIYYPIENARAIQKKELPPESLGVTAPDPRTVVFQLREPTPYFIHLLAKVQSVPVPQHVIDEHRRQWTRPGAMVSNGPYMLVERVPQSYIKLAKNPFFHDRESVRIDEVYWHPTQDVRTSFNRFRTGELDIVLNFPPREIGWIRENMPDSLHVGPSLGAYFIVINVQQPPFDDVRVRKALYLAIHREFISESIVQTGARAAYSFATPAFSNYDGIVMPEQALDFGERQSIARDLLEQAGYGPANRLTVDLKYDTQEQNRKIMVAIAQMWQAIGVDTQISNVDFPRLAASVFTKKFELVRWFYIAPFDDAYAFLQIFMADNPANWSGYVNSDYDALLRESNLIADPARRRAVLEDAERMMMADYPILPISFYVGRWLIRPQVKGWVDNPRGPTLTRYLSIED